MKKQTQHKGPKGYRTALVFMKLFLALMIVLVIGLEVLARKQRKIRESNAEALRHVAAGMEVAVGRPAAQPPSATQLARRKRVEAMTRFNQQRPRPPAAHPAVKSEKEKREAVRMRRSAVRISDQMVEVELKPVKSGPGAPKLIWRHHSPVPVEPSQAF